MAYSSTAPAQRELRMTLYNKEVYFGRDINGVTTVGRQPLGTTWVPMRISSATCRAQVFK
nr:unnamed protein product [Digitaria exilis]